MAKARTRVAGSTAVPPLPLSHERLVWNREVVSIFSIVKHVEGFDWRFSLLKSNDCYIYDS